MEKYGEKYPIQNLNTANKGSLNGRAKLNEKEVMLIRTRYSEGETINQIYLDYNQLISRVTLEAVIYGKTFKNLPIYKKREKIWIKPCIDYPQSLK